VGEGGEREGRAGLGYLSRGARVPSYATALYPPPRRYSSANRSNTERGTVVATLYPPVFLSIHSCNFRRYEGYCTPYILK